MLFNSYVGTLDINDLHILIMCIIYAVWNPGTTTVGLC